MYLRGSSDYTNLQSDLYNLLTGAIAAANRGTGQTGNGNQVAGADAWTGLDATNKVIRSKATYTPWTLPMTLWRGIPRFSILLTLTVAAQIGTPVFSGTYSGGTTKVVYVARVTTTNTVAGDLTGMVVTYKIINATTGATVTADTTVSGWAGASDTKLLATGVSLKITLGGTDQIPINMIWWTRGYSTTLTDGVDYFPEGAKIDSAQTITIGTTSGGVNAYTLTTDYALAADVDLYPSPSDLSSSFCGTDWGGFGCFSGIHWKTAGAPPAVGTQYFLNAASCFGGYLHLGGFTSQHFRLSPIEFWDATAQKGRFIACCGTSFTSTIAYNNSDYADPFTSTPSGGVFINYWISIKTDKIIVLLRGDPANNGGQFNIFSFQLATATHTAEKVPWHFAAQGADAVDAQCRGGMYLYHGAYVYSTPYWGTTTFGYLSQSSTGVWGRGNVGQQMRWIAGIPPIPISGDAKWWLYPLYPEASDGGGYDGSGTFTVGTNSSGIKAKLRGLWFISSTGISSLDELVDGGNTYLIFTQGNAPGVFGTASTYYPYPGQSLMAILEE